MKTTFEATKKLNGSMLTISQLNICCKPNLQFSGHIQASDQQGVPRKILQLSYSDFSSQNSYLGITRIVLKSTQQKLRYLRLKTPGVIFRIHIKMNQNFADLFLLDVTRQTFTLIYTLLALVKSFRHLYRRRRVNGYEILTLFDISFFLVHLT